MMDTCMGRERGGEGTEKASQRRMEATAHNFERHGGKGSNRGGVGSTPPRRREDIRRAGAHRRRGL